MKRIVTPSTARSSTSRTIAVAARQPVVALDAAESRRIARASRARQMSGDERGSSRAHRPAATMGDACARGRGRAEDGRPARARPARGRPRGRRRRPRRGRPLDGAGGRVRRDRPRRDASRARRVRDVPRAARGRGVDAGPDADRARRGRGPDRRPRRRRRRLPAEAVLVRRAPRAAAGARPAGARASGRRARGRDAAARSRRTRRAWRGETELDLSAKEFALLEAFMRRPGRGPLARPAARGGLGHRLRESVERRRRLRPLPAREDRRRGRDRDGQRRRLPAAGGRRRDLAPADPAAADAAVRARHGRRARRDRASSSTAGSASTLLSSVDQRPARAGGRGGGPRRPQGHGVARPRRARRAVGRPARRRDGRCASPTPASAAARSSPARSLRAVLAGRHAPADGQIRGLGGDWRILAVPVTRRRAHGGASCSRSSLEPREETLDRLVREFLLGGSLALADRDPRGLRRSPRRRCGRWRRCAGARRRSARRRREPGCRFRAAATSSRGSRRR